MSEERVEFWIRIPDESTLNISVTGTTAAESLMATVDGLDSNNNTFLESLDTAKGTTFQRPIRKGDRYAVDILLNWQTTATASVRAEVLTQSGERFGKLYTIELIGQANQEEFISLAFFAIKQ
jgi:hypothetical protein